MYEGSSEVQNMVDEGNGGPNSGQGPALQEGSFAEAKSEGVFSGEERWRIPGSDAKDAEWDEFVKAHKESEDEECRECGLAALWDAKEISAGGPFREVRTATDFCL
jgi:hypothetical protein